MENGQKWDLTVIHKIKFDRDLWQNVAKGPKISLSLVES
jgi:hypothetical protein